MRAQTGIRTVPGTPRIRQAKLLLVGSEEEFKGGITFEMLDGAPSYMAGRSATLLGALARLHSEAIDVVLLSDKFRDEELALFYCRCAERWLSRPHPARCIGGCPRSS
jgi:hypothetical protein